MKGKFTALVFGLALTVAAVQAQDLPDWALGPQMVFSIPQQDFANVSGLGEGLGAKLLFDPLGRDWLHLRADLAYLSFGEGDFWSYGMATYQTRNESFQLTMGPELGKQVRAFYFYLAPMAGVFNYRSVTSLYDYYSGLYGSKTTSSQTNFGWDISAGFNVDIRIGPRLDVGFKYQTINNAVKRSFVNNDADGYIDLESDATTIVFTLGVLFSLR
ncbi:MAG TPA: hypothetical protein PKW76_13910 [bacterium]|nr:hypothetical protein [bacterium]HPG46768.1 hypothetical protein [bacterium]HPM98902.1 hypothetical protein [bacterium]